MRAQSLLLSGILLLGCHPAGSPAPAPRDAPATLEVQNNGFLDLTVYLLRFGTGRYRLGIAHGHGSTWFPIPASYLHGATTLRFLCDPIGGNSLPITEDITVVPGDSLLLIVSGN